MHPEPRPTWEQGPAPEWDRAGVWRRIESLRSRQRRRWRQRLALAASVLLLLAGGIGWSVLTQSPAKPDEILLMKKDRELDTQLVPDTLAVPPSHD